jgi:NAD(P)-dependent dehydrogenase (short-subunit alcohol dehydrogenase family)
MSGSPFSLGGRRALVTGSESGLGAAIAEAFVDAGAAVVGADIAVGTEDSGTQSPGGHTRLRMDVADTAAAASAVDEAIDRLGGIDVCVNCAGIGGRSPAVDYPDELWERVLTTNLTGSFAVARRVGAHMRAHDGGSLVNIASIGGLVGYAGSVGYQASKGAIVQMTRTLAVEWGPDNIRVNAIAPGHIATELVQRQWLAEPQLKEFFLSRTPLGRLGDPADIANAAVFLCSDAARMITGHVLVVDGGYTSH